jgi:hypothetical protein
MEKTHHTKPCYLTSSDSVYNLDTAYLILIRHPVSQRTFLPLFYKSNPGQPQKNYATAWKTTTDDIHDLGLKLVIKMNALREQQRRVAKFQELGSKVRRTT